MNLAFVSSTGLAKACLVAATGAAAAAIAVAASSRDTALARIYAQYVGRLNAMLRVLFRPEVGRTIALSQLGLIGIVLAVQLAMDVPKWWMLTAIVIAGAPQLHLRRERQARVVLLEAQVDGFVVALANSLKTVPSPAAALHATIMTLPQPTRQEIDHVLREMRVGSTLEQGLVAMSARVKSAWLDVAFSAVLIGLRVGGNLPVVLERTAATIREMNRLLGVVRTKTSEGRAQLLVLVVCPLFLVLALSIVQEGYFDPMQHSLGGQIAVGIAATLWLSSLLVARKILTVDV